MEVGGWICKALAQVNPLARLAWAGAPRSRPDELNAGSYALVRLYRRQDIGSFENPMLPGDLWDVTTRADKWGRPETQRIDRGPVFAQSGRPSPDWDPWQWVPVYVANFKSFGVSNETIGRGDFLPLIRQWMRPMKDRIVESATAKERELQSKADGISREGRDFLWHKANQTGATTPLTTREERVAAERKLQERERGFKGYYNPYETFKGR